MINFQETTFKPWKLSKSDNCSGNCLAQVKGLFWVSNQLFWASQRLCCKVYSFEKGKTLAEWGDLYD